MLFLINLLVTLLNKLGLYTKEQFHSLRAHSMQSDCMWAQELTLAKSELANLKHKYLSLSNRYNDLYADHHDQTIEISKLKEEYHKADCYIIRLETDFIKDASVELYRLENDPRSM